MCKNIWIYLHNICINYCMFKERGGWWDFPSKRLQQLNIPTNKILPSVLEILLWVVIYGGPTYWSIQLISCNHPVRPCVNVDRRAFPGSYQNTWTRGVWCLSITLLRSKIWEFNLADQATAGQVWKQLNYLPTFTMRIRRLYIQSKSHPILRYIILYEIWPRQQRLCFRDLICRIEISSKLSFFYAYVK